MAVLRDVLDSIMHRRSSTQPDSDFYSVVTSYQRTAAEISAGVTPTNYSYAPANVKRYGAKGDGVTDDSTAIQNAIACALAGHGFVYFPAATYAHAATLIFKNNCRYYGDSSQTSILYYTGTSDQAQVNNPINSSTAANYVVQDLWLKSLNSTAGKANWADVGSSFIYFTRVQFSGARIGLILDQSEIVRITNPLMNAVQVNGAGIWIVNGAEHTGGASQQFTNDILVDGGQFNGSGVLIADDGGISHKFVNNSFNAGTSQIRLNNVNGLTISNNEMEVPTVACIDFEVTKWGGNSGTGTNGAAVKNNVQVVGTAFALKFANNAANTLEYSLNEISNTTGNPFSNINAGIFTDLVASGNVQLSTGNGNDLINNYFQDPAGWSPTWAGSGGTPALGNGTVATTYTRRGKEVLIRLTYVFGSTSTFAGTGWTFSLPVTAASEAVDYLGSVFASVAGTINSSGVAVAAPGATTLSVKSSAGTWGNGVPGAWANGDFLAISATFKAANWIG